MLPRLPAPPPGDPAAAPPGEDAEPAGETGDRRPRGAPRDTGFKNVHSWVASQTY